MKWEIIDFANELENNSLLTDESKENLNKIFPKEFSLEKSNKEQSEQNEKDDPIEQGKQNSQKEQGNQENQDKQKNQIEHNEISK